jgi:hypothetical protein
MELPQLSSAGATLTKCNQLRWSSPTTFGSFNAFCKTSPSFSARRIRNVTMCRNRQSFQTFPIRQWIKEHGHRRVRSMGGGNDGASEGVESVRYRIVLSIYIFNRLLESLRSTGCPFLMMPPSVLVRAAPQCK